MAASILICLQNNIEKVGYNPVSSSALWGHENKSSDNIACGHGSNVSGEEKDADNHNLLGRYNEVNKYLESNYLDYYF